jgi:hypothetical protein
MNLTFIESPANPMRLWLVETSNPTVQVEGSGCFYEYQMTRPIKLVPPDPDHLLISSLKMFAGKLTGFSSWQEAAQILSEIPDAEAAAAAHATTIQTLIGNE